MLVCVCVCVYVSRVLMSARVCVLVCTMCARAYVCANMCVCVCVHTWVRLRARARADKYLLHFTMYIYVYSHVHTNKYIHKHVYIYTHTHAYVYIYTGWRRETTLEGFDWNSPGIDWKKVEKFAVVLSKAAPADFSGDLLPFPQLSQPRQTGRIHLKDLTCCILIRCEFSTSRL